MKWEIDVAIPIEVPNASFLCSEVEKKIVKQPRYSSDASNTFESVQFRVEHEKVAKDLVNQITKFLNEAIEKLDGKYYPISVQCFDVSKGGDTETAPNEVAALKDVTIIIADVSNDDEGNAFPTTRVYRMDLGTLEGEDPAKIAEKFIEHVKKFPNVDECDQLGCME